MKTVFRKTIATPSWQEAEKLAAEKCLEQSRKAEEAELGAEKQRIEIIEALHQRVVDYLFPKDDVRIDSKRGAINYFRDHFEIIPNDIKKLLTIATYKIPNVLEVDIRQSVFKVWQEEGGDIAYAANLLRKFYLQAAYQVFSNPSDKEKRSSMEEGTSSAEFTKYMAAYHPVKIVDKKIVSSDGKPFDYVIIGSGPAGSVIANKLVKSLDVNVLLVEKGAFIEPGINTEYFTDLFESHNMRTNDNNHMLYVRNGEAVGGGSAINVNLAFSPLLPSIKEKISNWIKDGRINSDFIHGNTTSQDFEKLARAYDWVKKEIGTREIADYEINANNRILYDGYNKSAKYDLNQHLNERGEYVKTSAADAFLYPALFGNYKGKLSIISEAAAKSLKHDGTKVTSMDIKYSPKAHSVSKIENINNIDIKDGDELTIEGANFIVSAGTLGSTELLLKSDLGNSKIGNGLIMHPSIGLGGIFDQEINIQDGLSYSVYSNAQDPSDGYFFESMAADPSFVAAIHPGSASNILETVVDYSHLGGFGVMLVDTVSSDNKVYLKEDGEVGIDYKLSEGDVIRLKKGMCEAVDILFKQHAKKVFIPSVENISSKDTGFFNNNIDACNYIQNMTFKNHQTTMSSAHMQATNKLGEVISTDFKLIADDGHEYDNLYVCDSSVFPTSVGANPMQSIYTFAALFSDQLVAAHSDENTNYSHAEL